MERPCGLVPTWRALSRVLAPYAAAYLMLGRAGWLVAQLPNCSPGQAPAVARYQAQLNESLHTVALGIVRQNVNPVLEQLRGRAVGNPPLAELLRRLRITLAAAPRPGWGSNATALIQSGMPVIEIDAYMLREMMTLADLGGWVNARPPLEVVRATLDTLQGAWRAELAWARSCSVIPMLDFSILKAVPDTFSRTLVRQLAGETFATGLAWMILHETAHLWLGHVVDTAVGDAAELEADSVAFYWLRQLGYSLAPLSGLMLALERADAVRRGASSLEGELSPGPSLLQRRLDQLSRRRDLDAGPDTRWMRLKVLMPDAAARPLVADVIVPRQPYAEGIGVATVFLDAGGGHRNSFPAPFEWRDGRAHLYFQTVLQYVQWTFAGTDAFFLPVTIRYTDRATARSGQSTGVAFQASFADLASADAPITLEQIMNFSYREFARTELTHAGAPAAAVPAAVDAYIASTERMRGVLIDAARGVIDSAEVARRVATYAAETGRVVSGLVGADVYQRFLTGVMMSPLGQVVMQEWRTGRQQATNRAPRDD